MMHSQCWRIDSRTLQDYLDGRLPLLPRLRTALHIARCAEHRALLTAYRQQHQLLHRLYDPVLAEPVPQRLIAAATVQRSTDEPDRLVLSLSRNQLARLIPSAVAIAAIMVALSGYGGWRLHQSYSHAPSQAVIRDTFIEQTVLAFSLYGKKVQNSFRFTGDSFHKFASLFKDRFDVVIAAPQLKEQGYKFSAARVLPFAYGIAGQLVYRAGANHRIAIYFEIMNPTGSGSSRPEVFPPHSTPENPHYLHHSAVSGFYWYESNIAYAVIGNVKRHTLIEVAKAMITHNQAGASGHQGQKSPGKSSIKQT